MFLNNFSDNRLSLILFLSASVWGIFWIPLRWLEASGLPGTWSVVLFNLAGFLVVLPLFLFSQKGVNVRWRTTALICLFIGLGFSFYTIGLITTSVVRAAILFYLTTIWSSLVGWIWLSEHLGKARLFAIILGLLGLYFLVSGATAESLPINIGDFFAILSGVFWAFGAASLKKWPETPVLHLVSGLFLFTAVISFIAGLLIFGISTPTLPAFLESIPITLLAASTLLVPSTLFVILVSKRLFPGRVGVLMMSEVFVAILSATLLLPEEIMSVQQWIGGGLIIAACFCEVFPIRENKTPNNRHFSSNSIRTVSDKASHR